MKITELRISNWVEHEGHQRQVSSVHSDSTLRLYNGEETIGCFRIKSINPIPLTEEWLLKFGFEKKMNFFVAEKDYETFKMEYSEPNKFWWAEFGSDDNSYFTPINYVHQLQNLVFALAGFELNFKP